MAAALLAVLSAAKVIALAGHTIPRSPWAPIAFLWHDAALVTVFAVAEWALRRRAGLTVWLYGAAAVYIAVTIPVVRVLGTPLTVAMWRAAGGALSDSIVYYASAPNIAAISILLCLAAAAPRHTRRLPAGMTAGFVIPLTLLGPTAAARVDTHGMERNAWSALAISALPQLAAESSDVAIIDWRAPMIDDAAVTDLSWLRGVASDRNVVLVSLESTAAQYLGIYGATPDVAPNLTQLAQSAVIFDRADAVYPESIKGLFATLCSRYPLFDRAADALATQPCRSPAALLTERGYRSALFHAGRFAYLGMNSVIRHRGYDLLADAGDIGGNHESSFGIDERAAVDFMLRWIDQVPSGEHFFITYLPIAGHHPYESSLPDAENPFPNGRDFDRYRNAIHDGDAALGALIDGLRRRGLDRQTMWIIYGDHGEGFGQHEGNYGHTFQLFEENIRVPFLIALPGVVSEPIHSTRQVSLIDAAPTLLDLVGIDRPAEYYGRSALSGPQRMNLFFTDYSLRLLGLRDGTLKFVYEIESGRGRLFDLARDPGETVNVAAERPAAAAEYTRRLRAWINTASGG